MKCNGCGTEYEQQTDCQCGGSTRPYRNMVECEKHYLAELAAQRQQFIQDRLEWIKEREAKLVTEKQLLTATLEQCLADYNALVQENKKLRAAVVLWLQP